MTTISTSLERDSKYRQKAGMRGNGFVVDYQSNKVVALPLRAKGDEQDGSIGVMMMLGEDQYLGRTDRSKFAIAKPTKLLSLTVDR